MASIRLALILFISILFFVIVRAPAAFAAESASQDAQPTQSVGRRDVGWMRVHLCNGISKHTRTICCGTHPPAWCGKPPEANASSSDEDDTQRDRLMPLGQRTTNDVTFIFRDPIFYVCMLTSVTVIYLVALAGSGRDRRTGEGVALRSNPD